MSSSSPGREPADLTERPRIPALDGVRGLAILGVLAAHATLFTTRTDLGMVDRLVLFGGVQVGTGVDLFFVLSGCLITGILLDARGSERYLSGFYTRRVLRIFPLYYAVLLFSFLVLPALVNDAGKTRDDLASQSPLWFALYGFNILAFVRDSWQPGVLGHTWSLALEEQYYLLWPLVVGFVSPRRLASLLPVVVLVGVGSRIALALAGGSGLALKVFPLARLDCFAIGALVALALRGHVRCPIERLPAFFLAAASPLLLVRLLGWKGQLAHATCDVLSYSLAYGALVAFAAAPRGTSLASRLLEWRPLRFLGEYSYATYLVHPLAWHVLRGPLDRALGPLGLTPALSWTINLVLLGGLSLALALLTWHLIEKRFLALRPRLAPRPGRPRPAPLAS